MKASSIVKGYQINYSGISALCWKRIFLAFINDISGSVCYFLSLYFVTELNFNILSAGIIVSFYGLGTVFGGIGGGKLADKFGPELVAFYSLLIKAVAFLVLIKIKTFSLLAIIVFIIGFSTYGFTTSNNLFVLAQCGNNEKEKLKLINLLYVASNLGIGLAGIIISILAHYGFSYIFLLSSSLIFISAIGLALKKVTVLKEIKFSINVANNQIELVNQKPNLKTLFLTLGCVFAVGLIIAQISTTYTVYIKEIFPEMGIKAVGILFVLNPLLIVLFQTSLVNYLGGFNKIFMIGVGAFLLGFGMFLLNFSITFSLAMIACVIYTIGEMLFFSIAQLVCYNQGAAKKKGQSLGLFKSVYATSIVIGPVLGGLVYDEFGGKLVWVLCGVIGLICFLACSYYKNKLKT